MRIQHNVALPGQYSIVRRRGLVEPEIMPALHVLKDTLNLQRCTSERATLGELPIIAKVDDVHS